MRSACWIRSEDTSSIEYMFESMSDAEVVEAIGESARAENMACARRLAAIAELYERRQIPVEDGHGRELWRIDPWEAVAAEVAAVQSITAGMAGGRDQSASGSSKMVSYE